MGRRGFPKTPTETLKLRGSFRAAQRNDPTPPPGLPTCPDWLDEHGRAKWDELLPLVSAMGVATTADGDMLAMYCEAFSDFMKASAEIASDGLTCISEKGAQYQHPAVGIKNKAIERMRHLAALFGLSPSSRADLGVGGKKSKGFGDFKLA